jgi:hypothetical protein
MDDPLVRRAPMPAPNHAAKAKPDARPMRIALGAGGLAAMSALVTAIVMPPAPSVQIPSADQQAGAQQAAPADPGTPSTVQRPVQYIQLQPGQTAPPGATVIDPAAPKPVTVVTTVPAPAAQKQKPIIIKTTQSGKVVK